VQSTDKSAKPRLLIFIVAYNAATTLEAVLNRIPQDLTKTFKVEVLVIDDASVDDTFHVGHRIVSSGAFPIKLHVMANPVNQGYGGNQKIGYHFAVQKGFNFVALIHGDGQYAPECLPDLMAPLLSGDSDVVLGSRMIKPMDALKGGMPLYKFVGNRILTILQNWLLRSRLAEFHTGYRIYSVDTLLSIPFHLNSNDFHFDTEILIQCLVGKQRITELPIPTYYGDEISRVNGMVYAKNVVMTSIQARMQEYALLYDPKFDCAPAEAATSHYGVKLGYSSPHTFALDMVKAGSRVLDLGCAGGGVASALTKKGCDVTAVDIEPLTKGNSVGRFIKHDLEQGPPDAVGESFDFVLLLDVLEHLSNPENFLQELRNKGRAAPHLKVTASTGNIAFIVTRLLHLVGMFNYGKRGILDITHKRLFTFGTFRRLFRQAGYEILEIRGLPMPFPEVFGDNFFSRFLLGINLFLIHLSRSIFAYQIILVARPLPTLKYLLSNAVQEAKLRVVSSTSHGSTPSALVATPKRAL
jgi:glycosyltransferase involved in cell wall biosynthesis